MFGSRLSKQTITDASLKLSDVPMGYGKELKSLKTNSKPIINNLTILADENIERAMDIVDVIEKDIAKRSSSDKLPLIYLMDSILKNVGGVYVALFAQRVQDIFIGTFQKVDSKTKDSLLRVLTTWETSSLFDTKILGALRKNAEEIKRQSTISSSSSNHKHPAAPSNHHHVANPNQPGPNMYPFVPQQHNYGGYPSQMFIPPNPMGYYAGNQLDYLNIQGNGINPQQVPQFYNQYPYGHVPNMYSNMQQFVQPHMPPFNNPAFANLGAHPPHVHQPDTLNDQKVNKFRKPTFEDMSSMRQLNVKGRDRLYTQFPLQCNQCALRFFDQKELDQHYDWHFEMNKKQKEKTRAEKPVSRAWFLGVEDWIDTKGGLKSSTTVNYNPFKNEDEDEDEPVEELKPTEIIKVEDNNKLQCSGCGETFEQAYNSEADTWYYKDAIYGDDSKIYHIKCYEIPVGKRVKRKKMSDDNEEL